MRSRTIRPVAVVALAVCGLVGCRGTEIDRNPPPHYTAGHVTDLTAPAAYPAVERDQVLALAAHCSPPAAAPARPLNVLLLSGGGQYGAYAAGILLGWTDRGDRPEFEVVTGISSGALMAPFAFLGPKYDHCLKMMFTTLSTEDLFQFRPVPVHLVRDKSLASSAPLCKLIAAEVTDEFVADLRAAHRAGRRLFIGTMNLNTRRLVVWDLGELACTRDDPKPILRDLLLASASIPGLVPPVPVTVEVNGTCYRELHADGGAVAQTFVRFGPDHPRPDPARPGGKWLAGAHLYAIAGGKLYPDIIAGEPGFIARTTSAVSATLYALYRADLWRLYSLCQVSGMGFHYSAVPQDSPTTPQSTTFEPEATRKLFAIGYDGMRRGNVWRSTPPGTEPGEEELPRAGTKFTVP